MVYCESVTAEILCMLVYLHVSYLFQHVCMYCKYSTDSSRGLILEGILTLKRMHTPHPRVRYERVPVGWWLALCVCVCVCVLWVTYEVHTRIKRRMTESTQEHLSLSSSMNEKSTSLPDALSMHTFV